jgi:hypothetical protein
MTSVEEYVSLSLAGETRKVEGALMVGHEVDRSSSLASW